MPHLIIETTQPIEKNTVKALHDELSAQETVNPETVKTRLLGSLVHFYSTDPDQPMHVHISIKLLPGRSAQLKQQISTHLQRKAAELIDAPVSVEVLELEAYSK